MRPTAHRRRGFTLIEVMVACALIILIMAILATAFSSGLDTVSQLYAIANEAEGLRTVERGLRSDFNAQHFTDRDSGDPDRRTDSPAFMALSDLRPDLAPTVTPKGGFVRFEQAGPSLLDGTGTSADQDGIVSTWAPATQGHVIAMTVRRTGHSAADLFTVNAVAGKTVPTDSWNDADPSGQYASDWAVVRWYLDTPTTIGGVTMYALRRSVRVLARTGGQPATTMAGPVDDAQMSVAPAGSPNFGNVNTVFDVATVANRPVITASPGGDDVVLTNVVSFEVKPAYSPTTAATPTGTAESPYFDLPTGVTAFDTSMPPGSLPNARVVAVQVKVRMWDSKNHTTRQTSIRIKL